MSYLRTQVNPDGTFYSEADKHREERIKHTLQRAWSVHLVKTDTVTAPFDWIAFRGADRIAVIEAKARSMTHDKYPTVFLAPRKYESLKHYATVYQCAPLYVIEFTDGIWWVDVRTVNPYALTYGGRGKQVWTNNDREWLINVPVNTMTPLERNHV